MDGSYQRNIQTNFIHPNNNQLYSKLNIIEPADYNQYILSDRYVPPGNPNNHNGSHLATKRKYNGSLIHHAGVGVGVDTPSSWSSSENITNGKVVTFHGRDVSYPDELNKLIHPLYCELCVTQLNSPHSAKDHYESKVHNRNITVWLKKNYTDKGLEPPEVKRFYKGSTVSTEALHCELCDLKLTSQAHADQHYLGRKHRLVASQKSKPSGKGYYNSEGKWVRISNKPNQTHDNRYGSGELLRNSNTNMKATIECESTTTEAIPPVVVKFYCSTDSDSSILSSNNYENFHCSVCQINVTSPSQMQMHLEGAKHRKKLKVVSVDPGKNGLTLPQNDSIMFSLNEKSIPGTVDWSMYRTPVGSYYCKTCNLSLGHLAVLQQHLTGKKHLKLETKDKINSSDEDKI